MILKLGGALEMNGFIGQGREVEGTVRFNRLLRVDGVLRGRVESYDTLGVGQGGRVDAEIIVGSLQVHGTVTGRIAVDKTVEILPGGRVEGELYAAAPAVQIAEGGVFEGELHMISAAGDGMRREGGSGGEQEGSDATGGGAGPASPGGPGGERQGP